MSGSLVPYHLRPNKAVDREIFVDLLLRLDRFVTIRNYHYFSFGGAFLEDFKLVHRQLGNTKMVSLELEEEIKKRQEFNLPASCVRCLTTSSGEFINEYTAEENAVFWLDYAKASDRRQQLNEFMTLLGKAAINDIIKITLNAADKTLDRDGDNKAALPAERNARRFERLRQQIQDFLPDTATAEQLGEGGMPAMLAAAIHRAAGRTMVGRRLENLVFQPLASFHYNDEQHTMLTLTGILVRQGDVARLFRDTKVNTWELATTEWGQSKGIAVPQLTVREKLFLDQRLPAKNPEELVDALGFFLDGSEDKSRKYMDSYKRYAKYYPHFARTNI